MLNTPQEIRTKTIAVLSELEVGTTAANCHALAGIKSILWWVLSRTTKCNKTQCEPTKSCRCGYFLESQIAKIKAGVTHGM